MTSVMYEREIELINGCITGCPQKWQHFLKQYERLIRSVAAQVCAQWSNQTQEVEDLEAYVYEKLIEDNFRRLRAWKHKSSFATYLVKISKNLCIDYLKRHCRFMDRHIMTGEREPFDIPDGKDSAFEAIDRKELLQILTSGIESLSTKQALIIKMRLSGKTLREIAQILDIPQGTVFGESARAIERLKKLVLDSIEDETGTPPKRGEK